MNDIIYCRECGQKNEENHFKCIQCGYVLHEELSSQYVVTDDNTMGGLIPYKNAQALWAYYLGIFSLIPCVGILLGIAALVLGVRGLKYARQHPAACGKVHAWIGIIFGGLCAAGYLVLMIAAVVLGASN